MTFAEAAHTIKGNLLTPDANVAESLSRSEDSGRSSWIVCKPMTIGRIGLRKLLGGDLADPATVDVNYIRRSDAEIFSAPKH